MLYTLIRVAMGKPITTQAIGAVNSIKVCVLRSVVNTTRREVDRHGYHFYTLWDIHLMDRGEVKSPSYNVTYRIQR